MTNPASGGISLGIASGRIVIDYSQISQARAAVQRESTVIAGDMESMGERMIRSQQRVGASLDTLGNKLTQLGQSLAGLGVGGGVLAALGARTADLIKTTEIRYRALLGTQERVNAMMSAIKEQAAAFGLPVNAAVQNFAGIIPYIKGGTAEMQKMISVVSRLAILDPMQGFEGAIFAVREAISSGGTDLRSLAARFEISKAQLQQLMSENGGNFTDALDQIVSKMGITEDAAREMGKTFSASLAAVGDESKITLGNMFGPFFSSLAPTLRAFNEFLAQLNETDPAILQIVGGVIALTAATTALSLAAGNVLNAFSTLRATIVSLAPAVKGLAATAGKGVVLGGAAAVGAGIGTGLVKSTNLAGVNDRAQAAGMSVEELLFDDFKKGIGIVIFGLVKLGGELQIFVERVVEFATEIGRIPEKIANFAAGKGFVTDQQAASDERRMMERQNIEQSIAALESQLRASGDPNAGVRGTFANQPIEQTRTNLLTSLTGEKVDPFIDLVAKQFRDLYGANAEKVISSATVEDVMFMFDKLFVKPEDIQFMEERLKALRSELDGMSQPDQAPDARAARDEAIRKSAEDTARSFLEALGILAPKETTKQETGAVDLGLGGGVTGPPEAELDAINDFVKDIADIERRTAQQRLRVQEDFERDSVERERDYQRNVDRVKTDFARQEAERLEEHERNLARMARDERRRTEQELGRLERQIGDRQKRASVQSVSIVTESSKRITEITQDAQKQEAERLRDHQREMERMRRDHATRLLDAASNLDAAGVARLQRDFAQQSSEKERQFNEERGKRQEETTRRVIEERQKTQERLVANQQNLESEIAQMRDNFATQQQERAMQYQQQVADTQERFALENAKRAEQHQRQLADLQVRFEEESAKRAEQHQRRLQDIDAQENEARLLRTQKLNEELAEIGNAEARKLLLIQRGTRNVEEVYERHMQKLRDSTRIFGEALPSIGQAIGSFINRVMQTLSGGGRAAGGSSRDSGRSFAVGTNFVPSTGMYQLHAGEVVLNPNVAAMMRGTLGSNFTQPEAAALISGRNTPNLSIGQFSPVMNFGDVGSYSPDQIARLVREGTAEALESFIGEYLGT
ncbi:hypothetical protein FBQ95_17100 [Chloroflexi bacterium CFX3]|nr:hypothetical protein [Chloroflexi bacterium CFX3]